MTMHTTASICQAKDYWLGEVLSWAEANDESYDAIRELNKIPARMNMIDDDIGLIPADLVHFDKVIAPTSYGVVSKSKDPEKARRRGNSRVRALLVRFHEAHAMVVPQIGREQWDRVIAVVEENEGFTARGAIFPTGKHKSLFSLRARCRTSPLGLSQEEIDRVAGEATPKVRKSINKGIKLINQLITLQNVLPEVRGLLPSVGFKLPGSPDRARRILWSWLPEALRADIEAVFQQTLAKPEDRAAQVKARLEAGEDPEAVLAEVNAYAKTRRRKIDNPTAALSGYRNAVTWLWRAVDDRERPETLTTLADLITRENLEGACEDQIQRSTNSLTLKDPKLSQTLNGRLTNLRTVARHGLCRPDIVALIDLMKISYWEYIVTPKQMTDEAEHTCKVLRDNPQIAAKFVRGPYSLADQAMADIAHAKANSDEDAEDRALRLYAAAAMQAIQLSRPLRTSNIIRVRHRGAPGSPGNIVWIRDKKKAELTFLPGEIKNDIKVVITVLDADAEILWKWQNELRARFVELRRIPDSPYLFPGKASPRLVKDKVSLPAGCVSPSTMAEMWALGDANLGLGLTPHQCRHAVATLVLALEPGNYAKAAAILGDTEETVRKHYGCDSGQAAATEVRQALLAHHPDLFKKMKRKLAK
ncbi:site-specific integrase [Actibacterium lipolyticum]|uniref:Uncharacterized protein n=1 Tax=Actibacterium lipolyticum TaxID=1524263 RepID=A0A238JX84_9RHOB|nr:site-specific integrase [Actibacterium lipolyticum]SMX35268.1 hypothetical protein COL8621_01734 [Actibacterium lipolyticum]